MTVKRFESDRGQGLVGRPAVRWIDRIEKCLERWQEWVNVAKWECKSGRTSHL